MQNKIAQGLPASLVALASTDAINDKNTVAQYQIFVDWKMDATQQVQQDQLLAYVKVMKLVSNPKRTILLGSSDLKSACSGKLDERLVGKEHICESIEALKQQNLCRMLLFFF